MQRHERLWMPADVGEPPERFHSSLGEEGSPEAGTRAPLMP